GVTRTESGLAVAKNVPCDSRVRSEIFVVHVVDSVDVRAHLQETSRRIENSFLLVFILHGSVDFVAQPVAKREPGFDLPIVLGIKTDAVLGDVPMGVAKAAVGKIGLAEQ